MLGSALLLASLLAGGWSAQAAPPTCTTPPAHWQRATAAPSAQAPALVFNTVHLAADGRTLWNGLELPETYVRQYLGIVKTMKPLPLTVLTYSGKTSCASIEGARALIDEVIQCKQAGECLEVFPSRA